MKQNLVRGTSHLRCHYREVRIQPQRMAMTWPHMLYGEEKDFCLKYIYGNYFQHLEEYENVEAEKDVENLVLQEIMEKVDEVNAHILCGNSHLGSKH